MKKQNTMKKYQNVLSIHFPSTSSIVKFVDECMNYLLNDTVLSFKNQFRPSLFKIYSPNLYVLTCSLILWHWHSLKSVTSLHNSTLLSLRDLKITAKNVTDFEVGRTEISGQRELTEGRRAPWELTAYTPSTGCL